MQNNEDTNMRGVLRHAVLLFVSLETHCCVPLNIYDEFTRRIQEDDCENRDLLLFLIWNVQRKGR